MSRIRLLLEWFAILIFTVLVFAWATGAGITSRLDNQLLDRIAARPADSASDSILIVAIDDRSLAAEGQWPWDRGKVAALIDRIDAAKPKLIVTDVLYTEPSTPEADAALAASIARSGRVALPYAFTQAANRTSGVDPIEIIPVLTGHLAASGHAVLEEDADGLMRRIPLWFAADNVLHPHLQVAAYRALHGMDPVRPVQSLRPIVQLRPAGSYRSVSAASILRGEVPAAFLAGKVVMIGATAPGLGDNFPVADAVGGRMPGVELQANLLQALEDNGFVRELPVPAAWGPGIAAILLLFLGFWRLRPALCLALASGLVLALTGAAWMLGKFGNLWFAPGPGLLALTLAYPLWGWRRLSAVSRFLDAEAKELVLEDSTLPPRSLGGFDSIAKQVERLGYLVDEVSARRDFLGRVFEAAPEAMLAFDGNGRLRLRNGPARTLFPEAEDNLTFVEIVASAGGTIEPEANELHFPDGRCLTISAGQSAEGTGLQVVALTDVTAARQAEAERRAMLEFFSHDMRSPQVAILGLTAAGSGDPEQIARIERHARRTLSLADSFVELARLAEARFELEDIELGDLLSECADNAWTLAKARKARIDWTADPDFEAWTHADRQVLSRAVDNLVANALRYGHEGGTVTLRAGSEPKLSEVWFSVADDGPGLPTARRSDPFVRFGARGETKETGSGLGLAFVKTAIDRFGGRIDWHSEPGKGTEFVIHLPAA